MHICIIVNNLDSKGGWGRLALRVAEGFRTQGHDVGFIIEKKPDGLADSHLVISLKLPSLDSIFGLPSILSKIRNFIRSYDVVLCYDVNPNAIILNLANLFQKNKIVIHALATYSLLGRETPMRNFFMRWAYRRAKKILVVSEFTRSQVKESGFDIKKYTIVPVGVDTSFFHPVESKEKILPYPFILTVGALKPRKGYHLSIPAFKIVAQDFPDLKYVIIGDQSMTDYYDQLKNLVSNPILKDKVIFLEKISDDDLLKYYNSAELFLLTSTTDPDHVEGFGMVYLEAGACGAPVVGAYNSGAEAAIADGVNGFLVKHDPADIARGIKKILSDKNLAKKLSEQGIKRAKEFDWSHIIELYLNSFQSL